MKYISIICAGILMSVSAMAQTKGTVTFGANLLNSSINNFENRPLYEQNLQSRIGYFPANNLAVGFNLETNINKNTTVPFGISVFTRLYAGKPQQTIKFFVEGGAGHRAF